MIVASSFGVSVCADSELSGSVGAGVVAPSSTAEVNSGASLV